MNKENTIMFFVFNLFMCISFAQNGVNWDTTRQFYVKMELSGKQKKLIEIKIPKGTTELAYRISTLEANGNISNSLANILAAVPYSPAKLLGGGINLFSGLGGNSKSEFLIFNTKEKANLFLSGKSSKQLSCYYSEKIIEAFNIINFSQACYKNATSIFLVVISSNFIEKSTVIVEAIPNIDKSIANGWNSKNKSIFIENCKSKNENNGQELNEICSCVLLKVKDTYSVTQYNGLLPAEKNIILKNYVALCNEKAPNNPSVKTTENDGYDRALYHYNNKKYDTAIIEFLLLLNNGGDNPKLNYLLAKSYTRTKQFTKSISLLTKLNTENAENLYYKLEYAHALLLSDEFDKAKEIYLKYKKENIDANVAWKSQVAADFQEFSILGIESNKYKKILNLIE